MFSSSTRSANYERLELEGGTMAPSRPGRKLAWKKIAIGCSVLVGLVWFFGPRGDSLRTGFSMPVSDEEAYPPQDNIPIYPPPSPQADPALEDDYEAATPPPSPPTLPLESITPPSSSLPSGASTTSDLPTSPETDPDPLRTVHCTAPYTPDLPLVQYALMIDAGSTGSRIHVYKFHNCGPSPAYEYEVFKMTQPGLSDLKHHGSAAGAAASLDVLLDEGMRVVPEELHRCTPVAVKATAGLRALGEEEGQRILDAVEKRVRDRYPFVLPERDGVVIMDGRDEGVYAWITVNYLMGAVKAGSSAGGVGRGEEVPTYAVLDLGGGSTQIVFEPEKGRSLDEDEEGVALKEGEHKYTLSFGGEERVLYQHSYLGYGLKSARESVHRVVEFMDGLRRPARASETEGDLSRVPNPCLAQMTTKEVDVPTGEGKEKVRVLMAGEDVGSFEACNRVLELVMAKDAVCEVKPCSFNGVYQPSLMDAFPSGNVLLLSYFYDRAMPLIRRTPSWEEDHEGGGTPPPHMSVATFATLARQVCAGPSSWQAEWGAYPEVMEELEDRPEWCLDLTFMHALLRLGYEFADVRDVGLGKRIAGTELGWCLGATIAMVGGGEVVCRA